MSKTPTKLKSELHHWWPKSLSEYWNDPEGQVYCTRPNGQQLRGPAKNFGAISNGHHILRDGEWQSTAEPLFGRADSNFPNLIDALHDKEHEFPYSEKSGIEYANLDKRFENSIKAFFPECVASLIVRSPQVRSIAKKTVEHYGMYGDDISSKHHMIAVNIANSYKMASQAISSTGLKFFGFSKDLEFQYGDGHFNNIPLGNYNVGGVNCVVPLTPKIVFMSFSPIGAFSSGTRFLKLEKSHVNEVNFTTQVYSSDFLFSRSPPISISDEFRRAEHLNYEYHDFAFLRNVAKPFVPSSLDWRT